MKISKLHRTDKETAKVKLDGFLPDLMERFGEAALIGKPTWQGDVMHFGIQARGLSITGSAEVNDTEVSIELALPMIARVFEGRIRSGIERRLDQTFGA